jgi:LPPG:FO 2-phospho-L-lactate transferase
VGGAKLADGLAQALPPDKLTVIVNTGDDFEHLGLKICPDLDTVCYTLAKIANPATGWGREDESWQALETMTTLGGPDWFRLGDRDLGLHLERTRRLRLGQSLRQVTRHVCQSWGIAHTILPMSDDPVPTRVSTPDGELEFQEYFVHRQCQPSVTGFRFDGVERARPADGVIAAISQAELILFCPSNPWVSLDPVLAVPGIRQAIQARNQEAVCPIIAVSPIIAGQTVKGPAAKMYRELGIEPSAYAVARHYAGLLTGFVLDEADRQQTAQVEQLGMRVLVTDTWMRTSNDRRRLALEILRFAAGQPEQPAEAGV